jgi:hypothetical protein
MIFLSGCGVKTPAAPVHERKGLRVLIETLRELAVYSGVLQAEDPSSIV